MDHPLLHGRLCFPDLLVQIRIPIKFSKVEIFTEKASLSIGNDIESPPHHTFDF